MKIISIRQPGYLPYLGFFKKIQSVDEFIFLNDVQYSRGDWDNRNKIRTIEDSFWLTVPILNNSKKLLNEVKIDNSSNWVYKHKSAIKYNYENSPFFHKYWNDIEEILDKPYTKLFELNIALINYFILVLKIKTKITFSSDLNLDSTGSEKLLDICKKCDAQTYLSGELGVNYLNEEIFKKEGIKIIFEKFIHPTYSQKYEKFIPNMSIIDLLFNEGENSIDILKNSKNY
ncbi:WbqC family protein [Nitrosopumilus sp.]|nr:WbqC family protein [Nitrosopumilus sp.]|tara:strand:- start:26702 stop:27391 length:690 start_codon:yes stop_codon:yes gene_type:complete